MGHPSSWQAGFLKDTVDSGLLTRKAVQLPLTNCLVLA